MTTFAAILAADGPRPPGALAVGGKDVGLLDHRPKLRQAP